MGQQKQKDNEKWGALILGVLLLFAGGALFVKPSLFINKSEQSSYQQQQQAIDQSIDRNLKAADVKRQLEELKVRIENEKAQRLREIEAYNRGGNPTNLQLKQESHASDIMAEIEENSLRGDEGYLDPSDVVERRIARDQVLADYDRKYKKEYIRSFIQNARDNGLEVELNEDLEVIGIRELPSDEPMRFPNSVGGQGGSAQ